MLNYTKGEWRPTGFAIYVDEKRILEFNTHNGISITENQTNLDLASASPDMYEALKQAKETIEEMSKLHPNGKHWVIDSKLLIIGDCILDTYGKILKWNLLKTSLTNTNGFRLYLASLLSIFHNGLMLFGTWQKKSQGNQ